MRIDAFEAGGTVATGETRGTAAAGAGQGAGATAGAASAQLASTLPEDHATLSGSETSPQSIAAEIISNAAARSARVETLKQAVAGGQYTVNADEVAQAMIEESN